MKLVSRIWALGAQQRGSAPLMERLVGVFIQNPRHGTQHAACVNRVLGSRAEAHRPSNTELTHGVLRRTHGEAPPPGHGLDLDAWLRTDGRVGEPRSPPDSNSIILSAVPQQ